MSEIVTTTPENEMAMARAFDNDPGSVGLIFDAEGQALSAWTLTQKFKAYGPGGESTIVKAGISTTASGQSWDWVHDDETNPLGFIYDKDLGCPEWADGAERFFEITADRLVDMTYDESGVRADGETLAREILDAGGGRFFAFVDEHNTVSLLTRGQDGAWQGTSCGEDVRYLGPFPSTGSKLSEVVEGYGYDTPFREDVLPDAFNNAVRVDVSGVLPNVGS